MIINLIRYFENFTSLKKSPVYDMEELISRIKKSKIKEFYADKIFDIKDKPVYVIGSSFGGTVALSLAGNSEVAKIISLSPFPLLSISRLITKTGTSKTCLLWEDL
jgi:pimeloyl-ACP methyl ester carboxylesterase